ncbi:LTA synthase family protein [Cellvibrio mixtus]|uniref:LTA synthase family protein n=1 Tax=Cellvibrio mixtus TaxID=39650 RepID=UPI0005876349|nr:alkaline phosphatase family protein [Cellvibrio mixtus]
MHTLTLSNRWALFVDFFSHAVSCSLIAIVLMQLLRLITLYQFSDEIIAQDLPSYLLHALRWDLKLVATSIALGLLISALLIAIKPGVFALRTYRAINLLFLLLFCSLGFIHTIYWHSVGQPFDIFIFGIVDDQTTELVKLFVTQYSPLTNGVLLILICAMGLFVQRRTYQALNNSAMIVAIAGTRRAAIKSICIVLAIIVLAIAARGSLSLFPLNKKTTHFSSSSFMNNLSINAPNHLYYAFKEKSKNSVNNNPQQALKSRGYANLDEAKADLLATYDTTPQGVPLLKKSRAPHFEKLPNVVLVMMESWSSQILLADSEQQNLLGSFREQKNRGALFTRFLSTRLGTNRFIESTLLNTSVLELSTSSAKNHQLAFSNLQPFIAKGYQIAFVSGGARSWLNHDNFWKTQGVNYYWDMSDIIKAYGIDKHSDWGVHDEYTYRFALEKLRELSAAQQPVFMFIITTSNHPPHKVPSGYDVPMFATAAFDEHLIQPENAQMQMATFRYASDQLGKFLQEVDNSPLDNDTIRMATGDHVLRSFYQFSSKSDKLLAGAVPFYIQVPMAYMSGKKWDTSIIGSQRDIFPTLFELILADATYLKTGFDLLAADEPRAAWYEHDIWVRDNQVTFNNDAVAHSYDNQLKVTDQITPSSSLHDYRKHINALEALLEWQLVSEMGDAKK